MKDARCCCPTRDQGAPTRASAHRSGKSVRYPRHISVFLGRIPSHGVGRCQGLGSYRPRCHRGGARVSRPSPRRGGRTTRSCHRGDRGHPFRGLPAPIPCPKDRSAIRSKSSRTKHPNACRSRRSRHTPIGSSSPTGGAPRGRWLPTCAASRGPPASASTRLRPSPWLLPVLSRSTRRNWQAARSSTPLYISCRTARRSRR